MKQKSINFDKKIERIGTNCVKYDGLQSYFGVTDVKPLWVADMDFTIPKFVQKGLQKKLKQQIFGYEIPSENSFEAIMNWQKRHELSLQKEDILICSGVVPSLRVAVESFSEIGDEVVVFPPVYFPFFSVIKESDRELIESNLVLKEGKYEIDFEDFHSKITPKTKILLLCSPHNPVGRVWSKEELTKLNEICKKHNILVVSDEIHSDLVFSKFTSFAIINPASLILNAPSKTFNVAGFNTSYAFSLDSKIMEQFKISAKKHHITSLNSFSNTIIESCYSNEGSIWLDELLVYLKKNIDVTEEFFTQYLPNIKVIKSEATYLLWLDFKETGLKHKKIKEKLLYDAKVALNDGITFGKNGKYFFRLNVALPKKELKKSLKRIAKEF
ncbi:MAG: PatB family C-S lyase [Arcobacteraceae bacterium]|jgi:cystathionine beta-lyase|nr:PatB family C-S lyase [Arcobacteraceae bacterium]